KLTRSEARAARCAPVATRVFPDPVGVDSTTFSPARRATSASSWWGYSGSPRSAAQPENAAYTSSGPEPSASIVVSGESVAVIAAHPCIRRGDVASARGAVRACRRVGGPAGQVYAVGAAGLAQQVAHVGAHRLLAHHEVP